MFATLTTLKSRNFLSTTIAFAAAALLGGCHSSSGSHSTPPPPPTVPGITYDVVHLIKDPKVLIRVKPTGLNELDMVAGIIFHPEGPSRAFLHDGTRLIDLGDFGGASSQAFGVNRCGHVAGWALGTVGDIPQAFKYDGTLRNLGTAGRYSQAHALNDCDKVAGGASFGGPNHAFLYDGVLRDLGTLGGNTSFAVDVNASAMVTGNSEVAATVHAFLYNRAASATMLDLGTLGGVRSIAAALNDAGQVAGTSENAEGKARAFRYAAGVMHDLGTLVGGDSSEAFEINASGFVVGTSTATEGAIHGFVHDGVRMHDIGTLGGRFSEALAINAGGVVVGASVLAGASENRAVSWTLTGGLVDLNTRLHAAPAGLVVKQALAINDKGTIVAISNDGLVLLKVRP